MQDALDRLEQAGSLVRWEGGFWTTPGCAIAKRYQSYDVPEWYVETGTINALKARGRLYVTKTQPRAGFAIEVKPRPIGRAFA